MLGDGHRSGLIEPGVGVYTSTRIARILQQQGVTSDKVRYWLDKGLLGEPIRWGRRGKPHLLSFEQLLKVRTIQRLRDSGIPLQKITPAVRKLSSYLWDHLFDAEWHELMFFRADSGHVGVMDEWKRAVVVETGQWIMPETLEDLGDYLRQTRGDWERKEVEIRDFPRLVSNAKILGGSPIIKGTRVETSFIAYMATSLGEDDVLKLYPRLDREALQEAVEFEGAKPLAA